jgi:glutaredoxin 3
MSHDYKIEIFSQKNCAGCKQVKQLLTDRKIIFREYMIDSATDSQYKKELFKRLPDCRTVPQVFIGGKHIGGLEDLVRELHTNDYT